jgi:hypothetical protein
MSNRPDDTSSKSKQPSAKPEQPSHPGMLGDGTEEQNLNQPGNPKARISRDEVEDTFEKPQTPKK